jgi:hypothetical protein
MMTIFSDFCIQYAVWNLQGWTSCHGPTGLVSLIIIILSVWFLSCILQFLDTSDFAAMSSNYLMLINGRTVPMTGTTNVAFEFNLLAYCWFGIQPDLLIVSNPPHTNVIQKSMSPWQTVGFNQVPHPRVSLLCYSLHLCCVKNHIVASSYYTLSSWSCRRGWRSGLGIGRLKETMQLQLMCCVLSNFLHFQFTRGWIR